MPTLLDTHAWLWWVAEDKRLSARTRAIVEKARRQQDLWLSVISMWEIAKKAEKQQLVFDRPVDQWLAAAVAVEGLRLWELTPPILIQSCQLPQPFHGDPADQMIVATARHHGAVLVTKDAQIRRYPHVRSIW